MSNTKLPNKKPEVYLSLALKKAIKLVKSFKQYRIITKEVMMDEVRELILVLAEKVVDVDGKKMVDLQVLVDLLNARKIKVATFPDGPPDGG